MNEKGRIAIKILVVLLIILIIALAVLLVLKIKGGQTVLTDNKLETTEQNTIEEIEEKEHKQD